MGFSIPFHGWFLFLEILTLLVYLVDLVLITRNYRELLRRQRKVCPGKDKSMAGNRDELEKKIVHTRLELITSLIGIMPFSWILQS